VSLALGGGCAQAQIDTCRPLLRSRASVPASDLSDRCDFTSGRAAGFAARLPGRDGPEHRSAVESCCRRPAIGFWRRGAEWLHRPRLSMSEIACSRQLTGELSWHTRIAWLERKIAEAKLSMFDYDPPKEKEPVDYTGLIFAAILAPVFLLFIYLGKPDMGLAVFIVLGMMMFAVKIRWNLRKHFWFWAVIGFILALHVPLVLMVRWPQGSAPTLFYTMPLGIADFLIISGAVRLAERLFCKGSSPADEQD